MKILSFGHLAPPTTQPPSLPQVRFGSNTDDVFFALVGPGDTTPDKAREAELKQYIEHLEAVLGELSHDWEVREPVGHRLQTAGLRLREESQREEATDEFKSAIADVFADCAEAILDPLKSPADVETAVEEALRELKEDIAVHLFSKELEAF